MMNKAKIKALMVRIIVFAIEFDSYYLFLVRHKVKEIVEFIQDDDRLRDERKKAKTNRDKYIGVGSDSSSHHYSKSSRCFYEFHFHIYLR